MSDSGSDIPSDIEEAARIAVLSLIPAKSKAKYDLTYEKFEKWCEERKVNRINEKVLLAYFEGKKNLKASTLWTQYSMLRRELSLKKGIHIKLYPSLIAYLRRQSDGYQSKKWNVLSKQNVSEFLIEANDCNFFMVKVVLIIGISGACRKAELTFLRIEDVVDEESYFRACIPNTKTKVDREFVITAGDIEGLNFIDIIFHRKYINLRPSNIKHNRFFVKFTNGKCYAQPVGINTIGSLPKMIAQKIGLPNPTLFTGHCFRRSSATLLADSGANLLKIKQHGGWKSNSVAGGYVENSIENKKRISTDILGGASIVHNVTAANSTSKTTSTSGVHLTNCTNCIVNVYN